MQHPEFQNGWFDTGFIARNFRPEFLLQNPTELETTALAIGLLKMEEKAQISPTQESNVQHQGNSLWKKNRLTFR